MGDLFSSADPKEPKVDTLIEKKKHFKIMFYKTFTYLKF